VLAAATDGTSTLEGIERLVIPVLERIGREWEQGHLALSQVYMSGRICEELIDGLLPDGGGTRQDQPRLALAVLDDHHLLGKRMVYATLRAGGFAVRDYGRKTVDALVRLTGEDGIEVLLISALMLPSALRVAQVREGLDRVGSAARIVVGGAPFRLDDRLWREVGADDMGRTASDVVAAIARVSGERS
jgi:methanogenic corrinoid protein MtbC1